MDKGTRVWRSYVFTGYPGDYYLMEATVSGIVVDGQDMVSRGAALEPLSNGWRDTKAAAMRDAHAEIVRLIGAAQAKADALADEILHVDLTTEEVTRGVA
jgi:hypothetical protein